MAYRTKLIRTDDQDWVLKTANNMISDAFLDAAALKALTSERYQKMTVEDALKELVSNGVMREELLKS